MTLSELNVRRPLLERVRSIFRCSEGGALVELSVTLPIIFLIMTGIFAFSIAFYQRQALAEGVSAGAIYIARDRGVDADPCQATTTQIKNAAPTLSNTTMKVTFIVSGKTVVNNVAASTASCNGTTLPKNDPVVVQATYPCTIGIYNFKFSSCSLTSTMTEQIQ